MINIILQAICAFLFAVGALFAFIEIRTRYDRSFLFFGVSLMLLSLLSALDIWIISDTAILMEALYWTRVFQILSCAYMVFSIWYLMILTRSHSLTFMRIWVLTAILLSILFTTDFMVTTKDGDIVTTVLYNATVIPIVVFWAILFLLLNVRRMRKAIGTEKKILALHFAGIMLLCFFGLLDLLVAALLGQRKLPIPSFTVLGAFGFGIMASAIFAERFMILLHERQDAFGKLETAYRDLEDASALKQLGQSTAIINHEIRNFMMAISGLASLVLKKETLSEKGTKWANSIMSTVDRTIRFSQDILELSKSQIIKDKKPFNICQLIRDCIAQHFADQKAHFNLTKLADEQYIHGDWGKLEQVFVNIFKNALEAASDDPVGIRVKSIVGPSVLLITIEDNGIGCNVEQLEGLFRAFYTTKKGRMGTGLGMSISRTIVESHGGHISAYSKNLEENGQHGLKLQIAFPVYTDRNEQQVDEKGPIVLMKEGIDNLQSVIRVFQNVCVTPHVVQNFREFGSKNFRDNKLKILGNADNVNRLTRKSFAYNGLFVISVHQGQPFVMSRNNGEIPKVFSEEYVLANLL